MTPQLKDIGSGNFGVAKLMRYKPTGELVAVKFIERGDKVSRKQRLLPCQLLPPCSGLSKGAVDLLTWACFASVSGCSGLSRKPLRAACVLNRLSAMTRKFCVLQIDKNVEREIVNHRTLLHPNIIKFREASST